LSGPRLPPARGDATHLVVLCHGYGADGNDLIGLAPYLQRMLPTAAFVAPNGPERCAGSPGYQWFPITHFDQREIQRGADHAAPMLEAYVDSELSRYRLPAERLALLGFSQGTMMSLRVGLGRSIKPAAIVGFSGMLAASSDDEPHLAHLAGLPPVLLIHGDADTVIPVEALLATATALARAGAAVQWHISSGVGHSIDAGGILLAGQFLAMAFRGQLSPQTQEICCPVE
jgi:phospholipase/carboxylesterase